MKTLVGLFFFLLILGIGAYIGYPYYKVYNISKQPTNVENISIKSFEIPEGTKINELGDLLVENKILDNAEDFNYLANFKNKDKVIELKKITVEKSKWQDYNSVLNNIVTQCNASTNVVNVQYNNVKSIEDIAGKLTQDIDLDSATFANFLNDENTINSLGFTKTTYSTFFIPVKFEVFQDITKEELLEKLKKYYKTFWNDERKSKASELGLSQSEITILASIVYEEQKVKFDEQPTIAGLYINRLQKGWLLQADPTVKYALGDPSIKRLLYVHLEVDSPYNTYKHAGLPPGPISFPESQTIDAVLNYEKHDYMYMCAKPEYSGYHNFSKTLNQHNVYAKAYQKWLNSEGIK
jgi:UPF0755 protein